MAAATVLAIGTEIAAVQRQLDKHTPLVTDTMHSCRAAIDPVVSMMWRNHCARERYRTDIRNNDSGDQIHLFCPHSPRIVARISGVRIVRENRTRCITGRIAVLLLIGEDFVEMRSGAIRPFHATTSATVAVLEHLIEGDLCMVELELQSRLR